MGQVGELSVLRIATQPVTRILCPDLDFITGCRDTGVYVRRTREARLYWAAKGDHHAGYRRMCRKVSVSSATVISRLYSSTT